MIAEKNQELQAVEYRADMMLLEKEAMVEELTHLKNSSQLDTSVRSGVVCVSVCALMEEDCL